MKPDGGSAFPLQASGHVQAPEGSASQNLWCDLRGGISLRDYFAAQALVLMSSVESRTAIAKAALARGRTDADITAEAAYDLADALLKEREKV